MPILATGAATRDRPCGSRGACRRWRIGVAKSFWRSGRARCLSAWASDALPEKITRGCPRCGRPAAPAPRRTTGRRCWTAWPSCISGEQKSTGPGSIVRTRGGRYRCQRTRSSASAIGPDRVPMPRISALRLRRSDGRDSHPLLGQRLIAAVREQVFQTQLSAHRPAILADHKIQGRVITPGAAFLEMALAAGAALHGTPWCVRDMALYGTLVAGQDAEVGPDCRRA